jgi:hypothetical protein
VADTEQGKTLAFAMGTISALHETLGNPEVVRPDEDVERALGFLEDSFVFLQQALNREEPVDAGP